MRILSLVLAALIVVPAVAVAQSDALGIRESAERAAVRFAVAQTADREPARRRSMARTWGGVALIGVGLVMPVQTETCLTLLFSTACRKDMYTPGVVAAVGFITTGVLLTSVWSDVPANAIDFGIAPGRIRVGKTFGF